MWPWWLATSLCLLCLLAGMVAGACLALSSGAVGPDPAELPDPPEEDTDPGFGVESRRFPMH